MKQQRKLTQGLMITKEHYKMYKKGKAWSYTMIVAASVGIGVAMTGGTVANAAETAQSTVTTVKNTTHAVALQSPKTTVNNATEKPVDSVTQDAAATTQPDQVAKTDTSTVSQPATNKVAEKETESIPPVVTTKDEVTLPAETQKTSEPQAALKTQATPKTEAIPKPAKAAPTEKLQGREAPVDESAYLVTQKDAKGNYSVNPDATGNPDISVDTNNIAQYLEAHKIDGTPITFNGDTVQLTDGFESAFSFNAPNQFPKSTALITTKQQINFTKDFSLNATIAINWNKQMKDQSWGYGGDGMGLMFENVSPDQAVKTAQEGGGIGISKLDVNKIAYIISTNAKKESPKGSYDKNSWIIYQAEDGNPQQAINKPDNKPVVTNITTALSDAEPSKSINYSFVVNYQADDKTLTTVVKDESGADVTTWKYVVPDEYVGKFFTMAVSGATAASHAAYSAKINSYSYQAATATLNIISSGLPADITGPTQNGIKGMASDVVGFYRAGTTAPTTVDGKTVTKAIAVPDIGTNYLADNQAVELSGADNVINLVFTHDVNVRVQAINEDGKSIAGTQPLKTIGRPGTVITQTPTVTGYTLVPDQTLEIPETDGTVNAVYKANDQNATVKFVTTINGETKPVAKDLTLPGVTDGKIDYALIAPTIQAVLDKGYNLSPKMGSLEPIFDNDDQKDQTLEVVFVPIAPVKLSVKLVPVDAENVPLDATETTITGLPGTTIAADDYPQVPGYTVQDSTLTFPDKPDQKIQVVYTADTQTGAINFIDQDKQSLAPSVTVSGLSGTAVSHKSVAPTIQFLINQGYKLVTDGTLNATYDKDTKIPQTFKVILTKNAVSQLTTSLIPVDETGHMILSKTTQVTGVPGDLIKETNYPTVPGYTVVPDQKLVVPQAPVGTLVKYKADIQKAVVAFVDQNGQPIITSQVFSGPTRTVLDHSQVATYIQDAINKGYSLVSDSTVNARFDTDSQSVQGFKVVLTPIVQVKTDTDGPKKTDTSETVVPPTDTSQPVVTPQTTAQTAPVTEAGQTVASETAPTQTVDQKNQQPTTDGQETSGGTAVSNHEKTAAPVNQVSAQAVGVKSPQIQNTSTDLPQSNGTNSETTQAVPQLPQTNEQHQTTTIIGMLVLSLAALLGLAPKRKRHAR